MTWQIFIIAFILFGSFSSLLARLIMKEDKSDPIAYAIAHQILVAILVFSYALFDGIKIPDLIPLIPYVIAMTLLYGIGNILRFKALKEIEVSEFTIINQTSAIWTIITATLFLGAAFSLNNWIGAVLIILSAVLVSWNPKIGKKLREFNKGEILALAGAAFYGFAFANDSILIDHFDSVPTYLAIAFLLPGLLTWIIYPGHTRNMKLFLERKAFLRLLLFSLLYALTSVSLFLAYKYQGNIAQIAVLGKTTIIVTVILGILILKERSRLWAKFIGTILSVVGVILLI